MSVAGPLEWSATVRPAPGETLSGDAFVVEAFEGGALAAAIDGLGHGAPAALAAERAVATLREAPGAAPADLLQRCHAALARTRGAVVSLAAFDAAAGSMTWTGVGNVQAELFRLDPKARPTREALLLRGGVVGDRLPSLRVSALSVFPGDVLVLATDGIDRAFSSSIVVTDPVERIAASVLHDFGSAKDDALVVVARWRGAA